MTNNNNAKLDPAGTITDSVLIAIRKIIQSIAMNSKSLVKRVGLTGPQLMILQEVVHSSEISVGEVAKAISLSQGTVTGILERLEKRELVIRPPTCTGSNHGSRQGAHANGATIDAGGFCGAFRCPAGLGAGHDPQRPAAAGFNHGCQNDPRRTHSGNRAYRRIERQA